LNTKTKIINKSIQLATELFPTVYKEKTLNDNFHFAFGYCRSKLIAIGINDYALSSKALKLAEKFNVYERKKYPSLHAEIDLISRLFGRYYIDSNLTVVVIRLNRFYRLQMSKPCPSCTTVLKALNVHDVYWSDRSEGIQYGI
jgi:hypothetical protein